MAKLEIKGCEFAGNLDAETIPENHSEWGEVVFLQIYGNKEYGSITLNPEQALKLAEFLFNNVCAVANETLEDRPEPEHFTRPMGSIPADWIQPGVDAWVRTGAERRGTNFDKIRQGCWLVVKSLDGPWISFEGVDFEVDWTFLIQGKK